MQPKHLPVKIFLRGDYINSLRKTFRLGIFYFNKWGFPDFNL
jgi:hypothetical protein